MRAWLLVGLLVVELLPNLAAAELRLLTEQAPPTSYMEAGKPTGYAVAVVEELIHRTGQAAHIELLPWTRAYHLVKHEPDTALFSMVRTDEREAQFQWVGPILQGSTRFYSLKSSQLTIDSLDAAAHSGTVALPKQWYTYETLQQKGFTNLYGVPSSKQMVTMLKHGRVKLIATEDLTLREELAAGGLTPEEVQAHLAFMNSDYYIAFSPQTDAALVTQWQRELDGMRRDGSLQALRQRWLPQIGQPAALRGR
ncbi:substrate-binding periplasmic protein [Aquipseudomonas ullengensis]|uniref:Transporter substrate-binding domain-containing protein n=1 Tax=Aquipseudomonas ullengensis TaxID=2759166 RepID=A0A7W4LHU1_9GAMM|nr:transporter substrate-binding domain-containing protein [Pseudomonas ullengensis]MBB2493433.1 transporter substrate-binding domain-containing protein [Pseudomonas ullengensis]